MESSFQVQPSNFMRRLDFNLIILIFALNVIGLINLYSATHGVHISSSSLFYKQLVWLAVGWGVYFFITLTDYQFFNRTAYLIYGLNVIALGVVMFIGKTYYGAQRWIDLGFFRYQPSETMKLVLVLVIAKILSKKNLSKRLDLKELLPLLVITLIPFVLTVKQPDLGTALIILAISITMILFFRVKISVLVVALTLSIIATPIVWSFGLKTYQKNRILNFIRPGRDPRGTGYNNIQSRIAIGSGNFLGKGFRKGTQSQLEFLPERHTDFIFSVLSEEHGLVGSITTLGLFLILYLMGLRMVQRARDKFGSLIVIGCLSLIFWHMLINISMIMGLMPIVGVPLPLLSYGGSSLLTTMAALGLISSVSYRRYLF